VTSQSPKEAGTPTGEYYNAWASMRYLVVEQGLSWSGREKDHLFLNLGDGSFAELSGISGADSIGDGRSLARVDWNDDGRVDLFLKSRTSPRVSLYLNQLENDGHWVTFRLAGTRCNRDAIGARVELVVGGKTLRKTLKAGEGYLAQSSKTLHFGLGESAAIERASVLWPDGSRDEYGALAVDTRYALTQGSPEARVLAPKPRVRLAAAPAPAEKAAQVRVPLVEKLPLGALGIPGLDAPARTLGDLAGGPVLVNLWSTTCGPCLKEFAAWKERRKELDAAGVRLVTLGTDLAEKRADALAILEKNGLTKDAGLADERFLAAFEVLLTEVLDAQKALPLPTSFLVDPQGRMVVLYVGPLEVDVLLADLATLAKMDPKPTNNARLLGGIRMITRTRDYPALADRFKVIRRDDLAAFYAGLSSKVR
jgi:thiol-disulfide isomerase/thioredoxin